MFWHVSVHPSICLSTPGGVPQPGPSRYPPCWTWPGGTLPQVTPHWTWPRGYPEEGYPEGGIPPQVHPVRPGQEDTPMGVPNGGYSPSGTPPSDLVGRGSPHRVVLDTPRSICLLRSRRRTFLFISNNWPLEIDWSMMSFCYLEGEFLLCLHTIEFFIISKSIRSGSQI